MSDLGPTSELSGKAGEKASKAAAENNPEAPAPTPKPAAKRKPVKSEPHVIGNDEQDEVHLSAIVFESKTTRKSLSVHHVQRRLLELGYDETQRDRDGWLSEGTLEALNRYKSDEDLETEEGAPIANKAVLRALFDGDDNVKLVLR